MLGKTLCIGVGSMDGTLLPGALQHGVLKQVIHTFSVRREKNNVRLLLGLSVVGFTTMPDVNRYNTIFGHVNHKCYHLIRDVKRSTLWDYYDFRCCGNTLDTLDAAIPQTNWFRAHAKYTGFYPVLA